MDGALLTRRRGRDDRPAAPRATCSTRQLVGTIAAPLTGLVRTLNALIAGLAIQLRQIADQGLVSGARIAGLPTAPRPEARCGARGSCGA